MNHSNPPFRVIPGGVQTRHSLRRNPSKPSEAATKPNVSDNPVWHLRNDEKFQAQRIFGLPQVTDITFIENTLPATPWAGPVYMRPPVEDHTATVQWVITLMTEHVCGHVPQALVLLPVTNWPVSRGVWTPLTLAEEWQEFEQCPMVLLRHPVSLESDYDTIKRFRTVAWKLVSVGIAPEVLAKAVGRSAHVFVSGPYPPRWVW